MRKHQLRMCRFLGRTLPMFAYCAVWPPLAVFLLLPRLSWAHAQTVICIHIAGVLMLQVRAVKTGSLPRL